MGRVQASRGVSIACSLAIFAGVILFQYHRQAYRTDLASHPDEAAHFVTGVAVLDYVTTAFGSNPVSFAETYYVHYPKFALGHWPPLFYGMQALWFAAFGAIPLNGILLIGAVTAITGIVLFLRLKFVCTARRRPACAPASFYGCRWYEQIFCC